MVIRKVPKPTIRREPCSALGGRCLATNCSLSTRLPAYWRSLGRQEDGLAAVTAEAKAPIGQAVTCSVVFQQADKVSMPAGVLLATGDVQQVDEPPGERLRSRPRSGLRRPARPGKQQYPRCPRRCGPSDLSLHAMHQRVNVLRTWALRPLAITANRNISLKLAHRLLSAGRRELARKRGGIS